MCIYIHICMYAYASPPLYHKIVLSVLIRKRKRQLKISVAEADKGMNGRSLSYFTKISQVIVLFNAKSKTKQNLADQLQPSGVVLFYQLSCFLLCLNPKFSLHHRTLQAHLWPFPLLSLKVRLIISVPKKAEGPSL